MCSRLLAMLSDVPVCGVTSITKPNPSNDPSGAAIAQSLSLSSNCAYGSSSAKRSILRGALRRVGVAPGCALKLGFKSMEQMNLVLEATRQTVMSKYAPGEDDLYMRTLELGQVQESDFYSHVMHDDLDSIVRDIREAHRKDKTTADPQPTLDDVKEKFEQALEQGSQEEVVIHEFCDRMQIPFEKISSEDFSAFLRILSLSKMLKNPNNMRGKAKPQPYYAPKRKKRR